MVVTTVLVRVLAVAELSPVLLVLSVLKAVSSAFMVSLAVSLLTIPRSHGSVQRRRIGKERRGIGWKVVGVVNINSVHAWEK